MLHKSIFAAMPVGKIIHIGSDHAGLELKEYLKSVLRADGYELEDYGTHSTESCDYPDYAHTTAEAVAKSGDRGILICGSANGVCMTANKHRGIKAALAWNAEIALLARQHNDANVVCLPARFVSKDEALEIARAFLNTAFEGGRHQRRT